MQRKISSALISVFNKEGLAPIIKLMTKQNITVYSTGGTQNFIEQNGGKCISVESVTGYPSILGGRVKTLHPVIFGGFLGRRDVESDLEEMKKYEIPQIDLVLVDLYPFEETVSSGAGEAEIIEKIDIGGPSMIRAAAKNFNSVVVIADKNDYSLLETILSENDGETTLDERKLFAKKAFDVCTRYDIAISNYFNGTNFSNPFSTDKKTLRYGENPHQQASFSGDLSRVFTQIHGKELSYNNMVDVEAALDLIREFPDSGEATFAIIKHTNVCGIAQRNTVSAALEAALAGDPESAFGGVLVCNRAVDAETATLLKDLFLEVLIAPAFDENALPVLQSKKNRILLQINDSFEGRQQYKSLLNGILMQDRDLGNYLEWNEAGGRESSEQEKSDMAFGNLICKHLKSNAIAIVKDKQLLGKGCGQTSRIDALRQAIAKARQFDFELDGAVVASDAFFPFDDCVKIAHEAGISAFIQPGGSIRDKDSIEYCQQNNLAMVMTGMRHFRH